MVIEVEFLLLIEDAIHESGHLPFRFSPLANQSQHVAVELVHLITDMFRARLPVSQEHFGDVVQQRQHFDWWCVARLL